MSKDVLDKYAAVAKTFVGRIQTNRITHYDHLNVMTACGTGITLLTIFAGFRAGFYVAFLAYAATLLVFAPVKFSLDAACIKCRKDSDDGKTNA